MPRFSRFLFSVCVAVGLIAGPASAAEAITRGHAHNDYRHEHPLMDALDLGYMSVEADVIVQDDGSLPVAHNAKDIDPAKTLQSLYLDPLREIIGKNNGQVVPGHDGFRLLVDIKNHNPRTYNAVTKVLAAYADILTVVKDGVVTPGPVTIMIGNGLLETIRLDEPRYVMYDINYSEINKPRPDNFVAMMSGRFSTYFRWRGEGEMPESEHKMLDVLVSKANEMGVPLRLWDTPDAPGAARDAIWNTLLDAGVGLINTDDLQGLSDFLKARDAN